jgi:broad specificity phosphatase PhoE
VKIYLIRHGETTGDIEDRYGGSYDDHLTEKGQLQIQGTAKSLTDKGIDIIFSSPLFRARESAEIISNHINRSVDIITDFRERHYGVLTGLTKKEAQVQYPEAVRRHHDQSYTHPEGESYKDFFDRVIEALKKIAILNYSTVAIIAHGGSLKCILSYFNKPIPDKIGDGEIIELDIPLLPGHPEQSEGS